MMKLYRNRLSRSYLALSAASRSYVPAIGSGVIEIYAMIAIVVYALLAWLVVRLFRLLFTPARTRHSVATYRREL